MINEEKFFELISILAKSTEPLSKELIMGEFVKRNVDLESAAAGDVAALVSAIKGFQAINWSSLNAKTDRWAQLTGATKLLFERHFAKSVSQEDWQGFQYVIGR